MTSEFDPVDSLLGVGKNDDSKPTAIVVRVDDDGRVLMRWVEIEGPNEFKVLIESRGDTTVEAFALLLRAGTRARV